MTRYSRDECDSLERIVEDAKKEEARINAEHPERHGYGFIEGEADKFLRRLKRLERLEERAQQAKVDSRVGRIKIMGRDKFYSHSPESVLISKESSRLNAEGIRRLHSMSATNQEIYNLWVDGYFTQREIGDMFGISQPSVSRIITNTNKILAPYVVLPGGDDDTGM